MLIMFWLVEKFGVEEYKYYFEVFGCYVVDLALCASLATVHVCRVSIVLYNVRFCGLIYCTCLEVQLIQDTLHLCSQIYCNLTFF